MIRSPIAERIFKRELKKRKKRNIEADSYGLQGFILPPTKGKSLKDYTLEYKKSKKYLDKIGISMEDHVAKPLNKKVLEEADVIVSMHKEISQLLLKKYPHLKKKTFLLTELATENMILKDVEGSKDDKIYENVITNVELCVLKAFDKIMKLYEEIGLR